MDLKMNLESHISTVFLEFSGGAGMRIPEETMTQKYIGLDFETKSWPVVGKQMKDFKEIITILTSKRKRLGLFVCNISQIKF